MTLFDWLKEITEKKSEWSYFSEEDKKSWNTYMILKFLSMNKDYIEFIDQFQKYNTLTPEHVYIVLKNVIPKAKVWLKFVKSSTKEANKELIKLLSSYFECSREEAKINLDLLSIEQINDILIDLGTDKKQIKALMK